MRDLSSSIAVFLRRLEPKCRECGRVGEVVIAEPGPDGEAMQVRLRCFHGQVGPGMTSGAATRTVEIDLARLSRLRPGEVADELLAKVPREFGWPTPPPGPEVP